MKASITQKTLLPGIQSASGIEIVDDKLFVIGDDSSWLYRLDQNGKQVDKTSLFSMETEPSGRIPKKIKPDLEAMSLVAVDGLPHLLIIGSGSAPSREKAFLVNVKPPFAVRVAPLTQLYALLRTAPELGTRGVLNIEGLVTTSGKVVFLQRGNISGRNTAIVFPEAQLVDWLLNAGDAVPSPVFHHFQLPSIEGIPAGFSGAAAIPSLPEVILFTASVEATDNEIDDGEMLGSFAGFIDLKQSGNQPLITSPILRQEKAFQGKVESICVWQETGTQSLEAFAVTDSDGGDSELLRLAIEW